MYTGVSINLMSLVYGFTGKRNVEEIMNKKIKYISLCLLLLILGILTPALAQIKSHEIGRLWVTRFETGNMPTYAPLQSQMNYPGGDFYLHTGKNMEAIGHWIGVKNWTNKLGEFKSAYVSEGGYKNGDASGVLYTRSNSNRKRVRQRLPRVIVNGDAEERIVDNRGSSSRSASLVADEIITSKWYTDVGIQVERTSYAFANRRHDSYIISEYTFTNTGNADDNESTIELNGQNLEDVYLGLWRVFVPSGDKGHEAMGGQRDDWCHYYGNQPGDSLRGFWYVYDGDNNSKTFDDTGDPSETSGEFLATQYVSYGVLHADTDYSNDSDDLAQPSTVNFFPESKVHTHANSDELTMYGDLSSGKQSQGSDVLDYTNPWNPEVQAPQCLISFGPYNIPFGEDIHIVIFEAVGAVERKLAIQYGKEWIEGNFEFNGLSGDAAKNAFLATGKDSLHQIVSRAEWTWQNGYEAVPDGPESPNLKLDAGPGKIDIEWYYGDYDETNLSHRDNLPENDVDTDVYDFSGYRLYRAVGDYNNIYNLIYECGGNTGNPVTNTYTDRNVERGKSYYYYVTAFDDGTQNTSSLFPGKSVESSHFSNRNYQFAAVPFEAAHSNMDSIYVVPNPFHAGGLEYGGTFKEDYLIDPGLGARPEDRLYFVGLPAKAVIRIFTVHGDLVKTLHHPNPENRMSVNESADEMWYQITDSWQTIKSGVYFYYIEGWDRLGTPLGSATGKFVVIR